MAVQELFQWLSQRPRWQQDVVRRICEQGELSEQDILDLQAQIEAAHGLSAGQLPALPPLTVAHLVDRSANVPVPTLGSIGPLKNVDRLATGQKPLQFGVSGVTLIYGANGSGKSGYCRIAKKLCRCLGASALTPTFV